MALFKFQAYNNEMTELISQYNKDMTELVEERKEFERTEDALIEAYDKADDCDVVVLMRQSIIDKKCWKVIAKFY